MENGLKLVVRLIVCPSAAVLWRARTVGLRSIHQSLYNIYFTHSKQVTTVHVNMFSVDPHNLVSLSNLVTSAYLNILIVVFHIRVSE